MKAFAVAAGTVAAVGVGLAVTLFWHVYAAVTAYDPARPPIE